MRAIVVTALVVVLALAGTPASAFTAGNRASTRHQSAVSEDRELPAMVTGETRTATNSPLPNQKVRLRNATTGKLIAQTVSDASGAFAFSDVVAAEYLLEMVNAAGYIIGVSSVLPVTAGANLFVPLLANASGAVMAAAGGAFSLFGLGKATSSAVLAAAGALATAGVVVARRDASVSR